MTTRRPPASTDGPRIRRILVTFCWLVLGMGLGLALVLVALRIYRRLLRNPIPRRYPSPPVQNTVTDSVKNRGAYTVEKLMSQRNQPENQTTPEIQANQPTVDPASNPANGPVQGVRNAPAQTPAPAVDVEGKTLGYEPRDANVRGVLIATVALALFIGIGLFVVGGLMERFAATRPQPTPVTLVQPTITPTPPALWIAPQTGMTDYQQENDALLHGYGWVDQENGIARIPITQAMQLLIEQPLPARDQEPPTWGRADDAYQLESEGGQGK